MPANEASSTSVNRRVASAGATMPSNVSMRVTGWIDAPHVLAHGRHARQRIAFRIRPDDEVTAGLRRGGWACGA